MSQNIYLLKKIKTIILKNLHLLFIVIIWVGSFYLGFMYRKSNELGISNLNLELFNNTNGIYFFEGIETCKGYVEGCYYPSNGTIYIEKTANFKLVLLHELKHIFCKDKQPECKTSDILENDRKYDKCIHQGCFLNTPIDKEYGFIK